MTDLTCLALNCSLKPTGPSNTEVLLDQVLEALGVRGVTGEVVRVSVDFGDLEEVPDAVATTTAVMATNLAHVARLLRDHPFPPPN